MVLVSVSAGDGGGVGIGSCLVARASSWCSDHPASSPVPSSPPRYPAFSFVRVFVRSHTTTHHHHRYPPQPPLPSPTTTTKTVTAMTAHYEKQTITINANANNYNPFLCSFVFAVVPSGGVLLPVRQLGVGLLRVHHLRLRHQVRPSQSPFFFFFLFTRST